MEYLKTANDWTHNYTKKSFKRYLKTRSTRSLAAILRTKRLDAGFFWLEFYPLVRDIFMAQHPEYTEKDFEILLQLHANQPFSVTDIEICTLKPKDYQGDWSKRTNPGIRTIRHFLSKHLKNGTFRIFKNHGAHSKTLYEFSPALNADMRRIYEHMLCLSKIRHQDELPSVVRTSKAHMRKIFKQNSYKDNFDNELDREIKTSNDQFSAKLRDIRAQTRKI